MGPGLSLRFKYITLSVVFNVCVCEKRWQRYIVWHSCAKVTAVFRLLEIRLLNWFCENNDCYIGLKNQVSIKIPKRNLKVYTLTFRISIKLILSTFLQLINLRENSWFRNALRKLKLSWNL